MRNLIKKIIIFKLDLLAKLYLWRFKPEIIAITGNVGKTSAKEAIAAVLKKEKKIRMSAGNLNNEFGVPLTILGDWSGEYYNTGSGPIFWIKVLLTGLFGLLVPQRYPEILVLEYGAEKPGDIKKLSRKFKPHIAVVTAVGEIPVHVEYFSSPEALAREKAKLLEVLNAGDHAVLNFDDQAVLDMKEKTKAKITTYGFGENADLKISNFDFCIEDYKPAGITFKINHDDGFVPIKINGSVGRSQAWAATAGAAVGLILGMNLVEINEALGNYDPPAGRLRVLKGIKNTAIIDDTYNASPAATRLALETLRDLPAQRRVAILGDMLELGKYTIEAHEEIGNLAGSIADVLITVGARGKFIAYAAENQMPKKNIFSFINSDLAKANVQELIREGDLILVKGSQGVRMEKIVEEIMADPPAGGGNKKELLVRQGKRWLNK